MYHSIAVSDAKYLVYADTTPTIASKQVAVTSYNGNKRNFTR